MKLSVIIPVYNRAYCIRETLQSVLSQDNYTFDVEVIVVDDGSSDNSVEVCTSMTQAMPYLKVVKQENRGVGSARNNGVNHATGDYVWFVDSDDWIEKGAFSVLQRHLPNGYDAITFRAAAVSGTSKVERGPHYRLAGTVVSGKEFIRKQMTCSFLFTRTGMAVGVPLTIYRKSYLVECSLQMHTELSVGEDLEFTPRAYWGLERLLVLGDLLYLVRKSEISLTHSTNLKKKAFDFLKITVYLHDFAVRHQSAYNRQLYVFACHSFVCSLSNIWESGEKQDSAFMQKLSDCKQVCSHVLTKSYNAKFMLMAVLLQTLPPLKFISIYNRYLSNLSRKRLGF